MTTKKEIQNLECYKKMTPIQQKMVVKYKNIKKIDHHLKLIKNMGYKRWFLISKVYYLNFMVIKELINHN